MEIFKDIIGYDGFYQVSNFGRIKSLEREIPARKGQFKPIFISQKILENVKNSEGYLQVTLCKYKVKENITVHRLVAISFIPNPENKPFVNHLDGDKTNDFDWNLEWSTSQENCLHAHKTGLQISYSGESCNLSKLTEKEVLEIRSLYKKLSEEDIAFKFNVTASTINRIQNKKTWKHI